MGEVLEDSIDGNGLIEEAQARSVGKITILEALAEETDAIAPNRSNRSTPVKDADPDDQ